MAIRALFLGAFIIPFITLMAILPAMYNLSQKAVIIRSGLAMLTVMKACSEPQEPV